MSSSGDLFTNSQINDMYNEGDRFVNRGLLNNAKTELRNCLSPMDGDSMQCDGNDFMVSNASPNHQPFGVPFGSLQCDEVIPETVSGSSFFSFDKNDPVDNAVDGFGEFRLSNLLNDNIINCCVNVPSTSTGRVDGRQVGGAGRGTSTTYAAAGIRDSNRPVVEPVFQSVTVKNAALARAGVKQKATRAKPGRQFFITVGFDLQFYLCERQNLLYNLENFDCDNEIVSYCISQETNSKSEVYKNHIHCFVEYTDCILLSELGEYLRNLYAYQHLDIQPCRSKKSCLRYVSKEDVNLVTNVKTSSLHFNYRVYKWAGRVNKFDCTDPFVVEHRFNYRFLERYYNDFVKRSAGSFIGLRKYCGGVYDNWMKEVIEWWNKCVCYVDSGCKGYKRKQLYIYGGTNMGKSSLVERVIGRNNMKFVFYPGIGKFFMQGFDPVFHKVIVFEEFNINFYKSSFLKRLLEGRNYAYPVKCGLDLVCSFKGPIIFVSNTDMRDIFFDYALIGRLQFVYANCKYWDGVRLDLYDEVKVEVSSPETYAEGDIETLSSTDQEV